MIFECDSIVYKTLALVVPYKVDTCQLFVGQGMENAVQSQLDQVRGVIDNLLLPSNGEIDSIFITGSDAHGTKLPPIEGGVDDSDFTVVFMPSVGNFLGFNPTDHYTYKHDGLDIVMYSFPKIMKMLRNGNPNVLALLFYTRKEHVPVFGPAMSELERKRDVFLSKRLYDRFRGYAKSQISAMNKAEFKGYMGARRKAMVEQFGYDTKAATHASRVLSMGTELFRTEYMHVNRTGIDANLLMRMKQGRYPLDSMQEWIEAQQKELDFAFSKTFLPDQPDYEEIDKILISRMRRHIVGGYMEDVSSAFGKSMGFGVASGLVDTSMSLTDNLRTPANQESGEVREDEVADLRAGDEFHANRSAPNFPDMGVGENSGNMGGGEKSEGIGRGGFSLKRAVGTLKVGHYGGGAMWDYLEIKDEEGGYLDTM